MKYAIITPTYVKHFKYIQKYLESYKKFVIDKQNIEIYFTISKEENKKFQKIIKNYINDININVLFIEDLFLEQNISESPNEYLKKYGRYTFQTAKKFYTMLHVDCEKFLVLDSESMWIRLTNMSQLFENYFNKPFIAISNLDSKRTNSGFNLMIENISKILNCSLDNKWFIEHFMWFYDKQILLNMFKEHGTLSEMLSSLATQNKNLQFDKLEKYGIFEIVLYYAYLYKNAKRYGYDIVNVNDVISKFMSSEEFEKYYNLFLKKFYGTCGIVERIMGLLDKENFTQFINIFKQLGFNIIRCDESSLENYTCQKEFIVAVNPNILAASQEHAFGVNDTYKILVLVKKNKYTVKLEKHVNKLINPDKFSFQLLIEPIPILFYLTKNFMCILKNLKKYKRLYGNKK